MSALAEIGHNQPPEVLAFEAHAANISDLYTEATGWLDGGKIETLGQAEAVEQLLDMARQASKAADDSRRLENEPFDRGKAEVQARYNPLLAKTDVIATGCKAVLKVWRDALAAEKARVAEEARQVAEAKARAAAEAARAADPSNLAQVARTEALIVDAQRAQKAATRAGKDTVKGLRTHYVPIMTDGVAAARHFWLTRRDACEAFFQSLAETEIREGKRTIPGFDVREEKRAV